MHPWHITHEEWEQLKRILAAPHAAKPRKAGRPVEANLKNIAEASLYHHFASLAKQYKCFGWNDLPTSFQVAASSANRWYRKWLESGQWFEFWDALVALRRGVDGPQPCKSWMALVINELERAYSFFNWRFMGNALPVKVIVSVGNNESEFAGWFKGCFDKARSETSMPHVCVSISDLSTTTGVCHTLLHEMAHLRNHLLGLRDVGRKQYHNRHFRDSALLFGLASDRNSAIGYAITRLGERGEAAICALDPDFSMIGLPRLKRENGDGPEKPAQQGTYFGGRESRFGETALGE